MTYRVKNIGIAVALALVAGLLTIFYVTNYKRDVRSAEASVTVYVAAKDIPAGTSGDELGGGGWLTQQSVAKRSVTPGAISSPEQLAGRVSSGTIYAGEQVTTRRFTTEETKGIRAQLTGTTRALAIAGNAQQTLAGTLKDGDHVDIIATWNFPEEAIAHVSKVILRDILVLEAPESSSTSEKLTDPTAGNIAVILALTDNQAQKLFWVVNNGQWSLQLRPPADSADSPTSAESSRSLLLDGMAGRVSDLFPPEDNSLGGGQ
jgi:Flp pilus assembly protein CpaB